MRFPVKQRKTCLSNVYDVTSSVDLLIPYLRSEEDSLKTALLRTPPRKLGEVRRLAEYKPAVKCIEGMLVTTETILEEAQKIINGPRRDDYGGVLSSFTTIARLWSPILGTRISAEQVALCMIQLKVARALHGVLTTGNPQRDSLVDIAGYAGCMERLMEERSTRGTA